MHGRLVDVVSEATQSAWVAQSAWSIVGTVGMHHGLPSSIFISTYISISLKTSAFSIIFVSISIIIYILIVNIIIASTFVFFMSS